MKTAVHKFKEVVQAMHFSTHTHTHTHTHTEHWPVLEDFWQEVEVWLWLRRWRSGSGWGGGGLALGEEVEVWLWVRRQTPWDKLHVTFLTLYSSRVSSTVTCGKDGHYFSFVIIQLVTKHQSRCLTSFHWVGFYFNYWHQIFRTYESWSNKEH